MRKLAALRVALCLAVVAFAAAQNKTQSSSGKTAKKSSPRSKPGSGKTASKARSKSGARKGTASTRRGKTTRRQSWRSGQMAPTPERYKEIQQALIDKGYLSGPATGVWGTDSIQALRKFQDEQKLEPTGKLDALTLISLGLGPKRETSAVPAQPPADSSSTPRGQQ